MGFKDRMKKKRDSLRKRHNQQGKEAGGRFPTIFIKEKIPEGVEFFKCKEGSHIVDILPWEAGPNMPLDGSNNPVSAEGELDYVLDIFVHQNVGSMKKPYVCPYENFDLPCPICEYIKENRLPKDEWSKTRAKHRVVYLVWAHNSSEEEKKGVQIFEASHFFMEQNLDEIAKLPRGGGYVPFSDYEDGKSVAWSRKGSGATDTKYIGHRFVDREVAIPDKILNQTFALDSVVNMHPSYEEIAEAFRGTIPESKEEEDAPFSSGEDEGGGGSDRMGGEEEAPKKKRKRPTDRAAVPGKKKKKLRKKPKTE